MEMRVCSPLSKSLSRSREIRTANGRDTKNEWGTGRPATTTPVSERLYGHTVVSLESTEETGSNGTGMIQAFMCKHESYTSSALNFEGFKRCLLHQACGRLAKCSRAVCSGRVAAKFPTQNARGKHEAQPAPSQGPARCHCRKLTHSPQAPIRQRRRANHALQ